MFYPSKDFKFLFFSLKFDRNNDIYEFKKNIFGYHGYYGLWSILARYQKWNII